MIAYESREDELAAELYNQRAQSPREMTPERWAGIKERFRASAEACLAEARLLLEEEDEDDGMPVAWALSIEDAERVWECLHRNLTGGYGHINDSLREAIGRARRGGMV